MGLMTGYHCSKLYLSSQLAITINSSGRGSGAGKEVFRSVAMSYNAWKTNQFLMII